MSDSIDPTPHKPAKRVSIAMVLLIVTLVGGVLLALSGVATTGTNINFVIWGSTALLFLIVGLFVVARGRRVGQDSENHK